MTKTHNYIYQPAARQPMCSVLSTLLWIITAGLFTAVGKNKNRENMAELARSYHSSKYNTGKKWENYDRENY